MATPILIYATSIESGVRCLIYQLPGPKYEVRTSRNGHFHPDDFYYTDDKLNAIETANAIFKQEASKCK